jgi:ribosomal protein S18 acetylase RimI-like enzyme
LTATLRALSESDIASVIRLATQIWESHYVPMLGAAQVAYMVGTRFTPDNLRRYIGAADRWLEVLRLDGQEVGYCSHALTARPGELKLEQLYLLPEHRGRGLGAVMFRHVSARARALGCRIMMLQVNRQNTAALGLYRKMGFVVREETVFDIGQGFVMDDYIMEKPLVAQD